jgi:hypothetical protein
LSKINFWPKPARKLPPIAAKSSVSHFTNAFGTWSCVLRGSAISAPRFWSYVGSPMRRRVVVSATPACRCLYAENRARSMNGGNRSSWTSHRVWIFTKPCRFIGFSPGGLTTMNTEIASSFSCESAPAAVSSAGSRITPLLSFRYSMILSTSS